MWPGYDRRRGGRHGGDVSPFILMRLLYEAYIFIGRLEFTPYVTIFFMGLNIYYHVFPYSTCMGYDISDIKSNCLNPSIIVNYLTGKNSDNNTLIGKLRGLSESVLGYNRSFGFPYNRLFISALIHATDMHLYGNMTSLLWKGVNLERIYGGKKFLFLILYSWFMSHTLLVLVSYFLFKYVYDDRYSSGYDICAVGFSAVLFSLKFILNQQEDTISSFYSLQIATKYLCWVELVVIQVIYPNASFLGHFCGIVAGALYYYVFVPLITKFQRSHINQTMRGRTVGTIGGRRI